MSDSIIENETTSVRSAEKEKAHYRQAWAVLICLFIAGIALAFNQSKVTPIISIIIADLGVSAAVAGWISGIFNVLGIILAIPAAGIVRKMGVRKSGILCLVITLVGAILGYFAGNEWLLMGSRIVEGFGLGLISIIAPSTVAMWFPTEKRGLPMSVWSTWNMIAIASGFIFTGVIIGPEAHWRNMWIVGIVLLVIGMILFIWKVRPPEAEYNFADVEDDSVKITDAFKHPSVYILGIGGLAFGTAIMIFANWMPAYCIGDGIDPNLTNTLVGGLYVLEIFTAIFGGYLLDRVKNKRRLVSVDGILYAGVFLAAFHVHGLTGVIIAFIVYAVIEGIFAAAMWTFATQTTPEPRLAGASTAIYAMFLNVGMMIGAPIGGAILDATAMSGWTWVAIVAAVFQLVAGICFGLIKLYNHKGEEITAKDYVAS